MVSPCLRNLIGKCHAGKTALQPLSSLTCSCCTSQLSNAAGSEGWAAAALQRQHGLSAAAARAGWLSKADIRWQPQVHARRASCLCLKVTIMWMHGRAACRQPPTRPLRPQFKFGTTSLPAVCRVLIVTTAGPGAQKPVQQRLWSREPHQQQRQLWRPPHSTIS